MLQGFCIPIAEKLLEKTDEMFLLHCLQGYLHELWAMTGLSYQKKLVCGYLFRSSIQCTMTNLRVKRNLVMTLSIVQYKSFQSFLLWCRSIIQLLIISPFKGVNNSFACNFVIIIISFVFHPPFWHKRTISSIEIVHASNLINEEFMSSLLQIAHEK